MVSVRTWFVGCRLNEEMIESLFVVDAPKSKLKESTGRPVLPSPNQENRVLDPKKAQNIAISLRALNVTTDQVCEALSEGRSCVFFPNVSYIFRCICAVT